MKDSKVNGYNLNTAYAVSLSWPEFKAEYSNVLGEDDKVLKFAYAVCHDTAGTKPNFKGQAPINQTTDGGE